MKRCRVVWNGRSQLTNQDPFSGVKLCGLLFKRHSVAQTVLVRRLIISLIFIYLFNVVKKNQMVLIDYK